MYHGRDFLQVHVCSRSLQSAKTEQEKADAEQEITYGLAPLTIYKDNGNEECRPHEVGDVERETRRHDPCCECGTDVGTHNDGDSLCKR